MGLRRFYISNFEWYPFTKRQYFKKPFTDNSKKVTFNNFSFKR